MKTIQVNDETYEFLKNLANELKTQDNRMTGNPRYYAIRETDIEYGVEEGYADNWLYVKDEMEFESPEECLMYEYESEYGEKTESFEHAINIICGDWQTRHPKNDWVMEYGTWHDFVARYLGWTHIGVRYKERFSNAFLTEKAAEKHIEINRHNLHEPNTFLFHAYRNEELDRLIKAIMDIGDNG